METDPDSRNSKNSKKPVLILVGSAFACCLCMCAVLVVSPSYLAGIFANMNRSHDEALVRIGQEHTANIETNLEKKVEDYHQDMEFSEEEFLVYLSASTGGKVDPEDLGVDFEPGHMRFETSARAFTDLAIAGELDDSMQLIGENQLLNELYLMIMIRTADDGRTLIVEDVSTGNSFVDTLFGPELKVALNTSVNSVIIGETTTLDKIEFKKDAIQINYIE